MNHNLLQRKNIPSWVHGMAVFLLGVVIGTLYLQEPGLGDDIHYWTTGYGLFSGRSGDWGLGFHDLRWPVWGVCWLLNWIVGPGLLSYYGEPILYLAFGGVLLFALGRLLLGTLAAGWVCAILLLFHPMLDPSIYRPMPDLSEGFWGACAFLFWFKLMHEERGNKWRLWWSVLVGLSIAIGYSNRITGVFIIPALLILTLIYFRSRFVWLVGCGGFTLFFVGIECVIYWVITGDFLHSLHSNLGARGKKGTEPVPLWWLPFRFVGVLWEGNLLKIPYNLLTLGAVIWLVWKRRWMKLLPFIWFLIVYLEYSCGVQGFNPPRPLVRDGDRFIAGLAFPMSLLSGIGLSLLWSHTAGVVPRLAEWIRRHALLTGASAVIGLALITSRDFFDLGFVPRLQTFLKSTSPDSIILCPQIIQDICRMVSPTQVQKLTWQKAEVKLLQNQETETATQQATEFWYNRKMIWTSLRKRQERGELSRQPTFSTFFVKPWSVWRLRHVLTKDNTPDMVFYSRRRVDEAEPEIIPWNDPALKILFARAPLPATWKWEKGKQKDWFSSKMLIPESWRGRMVRLETRAAANWVEAVSGRLEFYFSDGSRQILSLRSYFFPEPGLDFFAFKIPSEAISFSIKVDVTRLAEWVRLEDVRLIMEPLEAAPQASRQ